MTIAESLERVGLQHRTCSLERVKNLSMVFDYLYLYTARLGLGLGK